MPKKPESRDLVMWRSKRSAYERTFRELANKTPKASPLYKALGSLAWGRYECEGGSTILAYARGCAYLEAVRVTMLNMGRATDAWDYSIFGSRFMERVHTFEHEAYRSQREDQAVSE